MSRTSQLKVVNGGQYHGQSTSDFSKDTQRQYNRQSEARRIEGANHVKFILSLIMAALIVVGAIMICAIHHEMDKLTELQDQAQEVISNANQIQSDANETLQKVTDVRNEAQFLLNEARNVLDEVESYTWISADNIFTYSLRNRSYVTEDALYNAFDGRPEMQNMVHDIIGYSRDSNVNPIALSAIISLETYYGTSDVCINRNNVGGLTGWDGEYIIYDSISDSIRYMADLLDQSYLSEDGCYYGGGDNLFSVNKCYCENPEWYIEVGRIMVTLQERIDRYNGKPENQI